MATGEVVPTTDTPGELGPSVGLLVEQDLRKVAAATVAGAVSGLVLLGWGSRLAMLLLARLNPAATGRISDDGFRMGEFNLDQTLGLVLFCTIAGLVGGVLYVVLRQLRFGPPWFRTWSMVVGPGVVGGNLLVHTDGVDFRILAPTWLAIALFVVVPGAYAGGLAWLADRWLADDAWFRSGSRAPLATMVLLLPIFAIFLPLAVGIAIHVWWQRSDRFRQLASPDGLATAARALLILVFAASLFDVARKSIELV